MVREALTDPIPTARKLFTREEVKLTSAMKYLIDEWLNLDNQAPKKQRHTARRIYARLVTEYGYKGAEPTIRKYVGKRRRELFLPKQAFIIQKHINGEEAEVDWYEVQVDFPDGRKKVYIFQMRACASGKEFHIGFLSQSQQAFLEAHVAAFAYFNGVFKKIRYDNLTSAVKKVLTGRKRIETEKFTLLKSHYLFEAIFCIPGIRGAHEKGGVEGGVGRFRRNYLVPVPIAANINGFNDLLLKYCEVSNKRKIAGCVKTIEENWQEEVKHLLKLPANKFATNELRILKVNDKSLISINNNYYSVPVKYVGRQIEVHLSSIDVNCYYAGVNIGCHIRLYGEHEISMQLDHYLDLLKYKPGAFKGSLVLAQAKEKNAWPNIYDRVWTALITKFGETKGTQMLIEILLLHREYGREIVLSAINVGLEHGAYDLASILVIIRQQSMQSQPLLLADLGELQKYDRPIKSLDEYNRLLN
jgi:transposase